MDDRTQAGLLAYDAAELARTVDDDLLAALDAPARDGLHQALTAFVRPTGAPDQPPTDGARADT